MKIIDQSLPIESYRDFMNQNLTFENVIKGFSELKEGLDVRRGLWQDLRSTLDNAGVSPKSISSKSGVLVEGTDITSAILGEALEYFCRAFYNFYAQDRLMQHGYSTWSEITNYYVSFFCIHSLIRLQGRSITRIWRPKGKQFYVFPYDFQRHQYVICVNNVDGRPAHDAAWSVFYDIYDGFTYYKTEFEYVYKKRYNPSPDEEIDFRNKINYEPYQGYEETWNPEQIPEIIKQYEEKSSIQGNEIEVLTSLTTDLDYRYYACAVLRLLFSHSILDDIAKESCKLNCFLSNRRNNLNGFLSQVKPRDTKAMISVRLKTMLGLGDPKT